MTKPFTVGVTGGIGSGKTAVTDFFASKGIYIADADIAARTVVEPGKPALQEIVHRYGKTILTNGTLDRQQLRAIIFADPEERRWLESLLHPLIKQQVFHELDNARSPYAIFVAPLMLEAGHKVWVDRLLVVDVPEQTQIDRTTTRDQISEEQARQIINSQMQREQRISQADDVVDNSGSLEKLHQMLGKLHEHYLDLGVFKETTCRTT